MLSLASKLLNLAVHPKIAPETISEGLKFKIYLGEGPQTPLCDVLCALVLLLGRRIARAIAPSRFHCSKRSPPDQTKIASYGPGADTYLASSCFVHGVCLDNSLFRGPTSSHVSACMAKSFIY